MSDEEADDSESRSWCEWAADRAWTVESDL